MYRRIRKNPDTAFSFSSLSASLSFGEVVNCHTADGEREALPTSRRISRRHKKSFPTLALKRGGCFLCNQRPNSGRHHFLRATLHIRRLEYRKSCKQRLQFFLPLSLDNSAADSQTAPTHAAQRK